ncbi:hypothetical protein MLD63_02475 (plasmid) [Paracoccus sp. TK19116]|uniref:Uncharacterized protein n=1 Tax=Paracoccus albicereus TaxID=2922394 RepID=A0ABT1MPG7_9RHOB|nr:hypothetical protein [Paracoccus albicereus]MCQ0969303.1 hypothetical protein [Paracoccus albicereus]
MRNWLFGVAIWTAAAGIAGAQPAHDPTWPCIQRKQPHLSLGQVWTGPQPDDATAAIARDPEVRRLAAYLEQRRVPMEDAEARITEFAEDADNQHLTALMSAVFHQIEPERSALIDGIARYGTSQQDLAKRIEARRAKMEELEAAASPDFDAIDAEEEALDWDERIFTDRRQSLTYVCETPIILEQRAFALGRAIASHLK